MENSMFKHINDDANQKDLEKLWGDSLRKLTPKQRQLVVDTLKNLKIREFDAANLNVG